MPPAESSPAAAGVALVIGSGSVKCAAALGLMKVLKRERIPVDLVVGCSGGSLYAAVISLGIDVVEAEEMTKRLWTTANSRSGAPGRLRCRVLFPGLFGFSEKFGLVDDRLILARLRDAFGDKTFADAKIPLHIAATDFWHGEQVILSEGEPRRLDPRLHRDAVHLLAPGRWTERLLADGFLSDPLPVGVAIKEGANVIIAIGFESPFQSRIDSFPPASPSSSRRSSDEQPAEARTSPSTTSRTTARSSPSCRVFSQRYPALRHRQDSRSSHRRGGEGRRGADPVPEEAARPGGAKSAAS